MRDDLHTLDTRGLNCPLPILRTRKAMQKLEAGEVLEIAATDPGSVRDMEAFCQQTGHELLSSNEADSGFVFRIRKA
jgi:tRNA 2-thiouridine synthesizing protein A